MLTGFAGVRIRDGVLEVDPRLPAAWPRLGLRFRCLGRLVRLELDGEVVQIQVDAPLRVDVAGVGAQAVAGTTRIGYVRGNRSQATA
jgi:trehalose/maltose hydrolase-like predicted phosphorylase